MSNFILVASWKENKAKFGSAVNIATYTRDTLKLIEGIYLHQFLRTLHLKTTVQPETKGFRLKALL